MARIRSIKPDFFTSEVITSLPLSARLTFIGLWTYVDDNGVGLDNERLIMAAIWPLEEDPTAVFMRTREDLMKIAAAGRDATKPGLVTRYIHRQRRLIHITSWAEHQKVGHPGKPRYPLPTEPGVTCEYTDPHEDHMSTHEDHGKPPEALTPEQGAGSREQGAGNTGVEAVDGKVESTPAALAKKPETVIAELPTASQRREFKTEQQRQIDALTKWEQENPHPENASGQPA